MGQVELFLDYLQKKSEHITENIYEKAKDCFLDYLAVTEAGAKGNIHHWESYINRLSDGCVSIIGYDKKTDGKTACLINGFNAHSLELDDGQRFAMIHLGGSIISALFSAKEENSISKKDFLVGLVIGYEAACRLSISMQPSHKKLGFHTAGTCGTVGAAIAVAFALKMSREQKRIVLTAAVASATGLLEIQEQASELKPYNVGRAAMDGLASAYMGFTDFICPNDILNGNRGFLKLFAKDCILEKMTEETEYFEIERIYVKPYAACRHCHSAIEAALQLRTEIEVNDIARIEVETYDLAVKGHDHTYIEGKSSAKLSIPYSVAVALILGKADLSAFDSDMIGRTDIMSLVKKVSVIENPNFSLQSPQKRIAKINIYLKNGKVISKQKDYAKGDPENPMTRQDIIEKAYSLLGTDSLIKNFYREW